MNLCVCAVCPQAVGKTDALRYETLDGRTPNGNFGWTLVAGEGGGQWLLVFLAFGAILTQYAIALELRLAYCGLQDANLDLQVGERVWVIL